MLLDQVVPALVRARQDAGISQRELGRRIKKSGAFISLVESGQSMPSLDTAQAWAEAVGLQLQIDLVPKGQRLLRVPVPSDAQGLTGNDTERVAARALAKVDPEDRMLVLALVKALSRG